MTSRSTVLVALAALALSSVARGAAWADTASSGCPCATWPDQVCNARSIHIEADDPRPEGFGKPHDFGTSPPARIVFEFDKSYRYGCFANGYDVWVEDPGSGVSITRMTPDFRSGRNGFVIDHAGSRKISWDDRRNWSGEPPRLPYAATADKIGRPISISKVVSYSDSEVGPKCKKAPFAASNGPCLKFGYTLTVVPNRPENNGRTAFRPPWTGIDKPSYSTNKINWALLPGLSHRGFDDLYPFEELHRWCVSTAYTWIGKWGPNYTYPHFNMHEYGADADIKTHACTFSSYFNQKYTDSEVKKLAISSIQMGIDFFHTLRASSDYSFYANAGFGPGRLIPTLFAAAMLEDSTMKDALLDRFETTIGPGHDLGDEFSEDGHLWLGYNEAVLFGAKEGNRACSANSYWINQRTKKDAKDCRDPDGYIDGGMRPGAGYMQCCTTGTYVGAVGGMYLMPSMRELAVGRNGGGKKLFDYVERVLAFGSWTKPDPKNRFQSDHGVKFKFHHRDVVGQKLHDKFAICARTTVTNSAGQPALGRFLTSCPGMPNGFAPASPGPTALGCPEP